mmetsp:Transcript_121316/g.214598  ORF Transcript_121316/g.214598 Transcript_121316/m.214598 type:complete len:81 (+) Transcript_121316:1-243(+)
MTADEGTDILIHKLIMNLPRPSEEAVSKKGLMIPLSDQRRPGTLPTPFLGLPASDLSEALYTTGKLSNPDDPASLHCPPM